MEPISKEERIKRREFRAKAAKRLEGTATVKEYQDTVRSIERCIRDRARREAKEYVLKEYRAIIKHIEDEWERSAHMFAKRNGYMSREMFRKIRACLHPDQNHFPGAEDAFKVFSELEKVLVRPELPQLPLADMPDWLADLFRR